MGVRPDTARCFSCGSSLHSEKFTGDSLYAKYCFSPFDNAFSCPDCSNFQKGNITLSKPAVTYLEAVSSLSPKDVRNIAVSGKTLLEMKNLVYYLIEQSCGSKLNSLESGIGIL